MAATSHRPDPNAVRCATIVPIVEHLAARRGGSGYEAPPAEGRPARRRMQRPRSRPPLALRYLAGVLGVAALVFNAALMLSDRSPGLTRRVLGGFQRRLSERIDADSPVRLAADGHLSEGDAIVHIGVWAVAIILFGMMVWSWRWLAVSAIGIFAMSIAIELGQGPLSETRSVESGDVMANATGVAVGIAVTACAYLAWSAIAAALPKSTQR